MLRTISILAVVLLALATVVRAQDNDVITSLHAATPPSIDGDIGADEWHTPAVVELSPSSPPAVVTSGTFSGVDDVRLQVRSLYDGNNIYLAVQVFDDTFGNDVVHIELGMATFSIPLPLTGTITGPSGDWSIEMDTQPASWTIELRMAGALAGPVTLSGGVLSFRIGYSDEDTGDSAVEGTLWSGYLGSGAIHMAAPRLDLLAAANLLDAAAADPAASRGVSKNATRIRKAADEILWSGETVPVGKSEAVRAYDQMRKAGRKMEKHLAAAGDSSLGALLEQAAVLLERAARLTAAKMVREAILTSGREAAGSAIGRFERAETETGLEDRIKHFRKSAKKAAKLF